jgi:hypothetical protein
MPAPKRRWTRSTGVTLEVPVLDYLQVVAEKENRDRSYCINIMVRDHAARHGCPLPPATPPSGALATTMKKET